MLWYLVVIAQCRVRHGKYFPRFLYFTQLVQTVTFLDSMSRVSMQVRHILCVQVVLERMFLKCRRKCYVLQIADKGLPCEGSLTHLFTISPFNTIR